MILLTHDTPILLGVQPADFRKGIDGFQALCRGALGEDPRSGTVYVFANRARTMIRALSYDGTGFWLMTKRLSTGRVTGWPTSEGVVSATSARELRVLLHGGTWQSSDTASVSDGAVAGSASAPTRAAGLAPAR